jgi:hypothetical protein
MHVLESFRTTVLGRARDGRAHVGIGHPDGRAAASCCAFIRQ